MVLAARHVDEKTFSHDSPCSSSPRHETFKSPSTAKRKSFKALPAIDDEDAEPTENGVSVAVVTKVEAPPNFFTLQKDSSRGSVQQAEAENMQESSTKEVEKELESKLRQMLERHSTKVSLVFDSTTCHAFHQSHVVNERTAK